MNTEWLINHGFYRLFRLIHRIQAFIAYHRLIRRPRDTRIDGPHIIIYRKADYMYCADTAYLENFLGERPDDPRSWDYHDICGIPIHRHGDIEQEQRDHRFFMDCILDYVKHWKE